MSKSFDIVCFGEPLAEFAKVQRNGEMTTVTGFGGDTMNVAVAAARQGAKVAVFTALGDDDNGKKFLALWDSEGIDRSFVKIMKGERTGAYHINYGPEGHIFTYDRAGSAASKVKPADVPVDLMARTKVLHVSGISQAISESACAAVATAISSARAAGALISYDTNLRLKLWSLERARKVIMETAAKADIARPGLDDAKQLTGIEDPHKIADHFLSLGAKIVALTLGSEGSLIATHDKRALVPALSVKAIDASGAGDAFGGAFLAEYLRTNDAFAAAGYANVAAALKTLGHGAVMPIPKRQAVEAKLQELS